jgi:RNA recognition motif-containing protein
LYKNDKIKIESQLHQIKKVKLQEKKEELKNKFVEQNGQHGDRSRNLFEIRVPKIIIRNISFNLNEEKLRAEMEKFGKVELVNLPKKENGKLSGFAFIVFENIKVAKQAIEGLNARKEKLFGTKVAADWCLPKNLFLKNTSKLNQK